MPKGPLTIGLHGRTLLELMYRYGALTQPQLVRLTALHLSTIKRQLGHLDRAGLLARARDVAGWKETSGNARTAYHLTVPAGAKVAAFELGVENDILSLKHYRRIRLPATVSHRVLANEFLISVLEAAEATGVETPPEGVYSESCPGFPLFGTGSAKSDRADSPYKFSRIVPDGVFSLDSQTYLVELETGSNARRELVRKLNDYGGRWRRMLRPNLGERKYHDPDRSPEPVVLLTAQAKHRKLRTDLRERLPEAEDWAAATEAIREASGNRADPLMLVLVASVDEVRDDPLGRVYRPLRKYPDDLSDGGWRVSLRDAAAISGRILVPEKPPEPYAAPLGRTEDVA